MKEKTSMENKENIFDESPGHCKCFENSDCHLTESLQANKQMITLTNELCVLFKYTMEPTISDNNKRTADSLIC